MKNTDLKKIIQKFIKFLILGAVNFLIFTTIMYLLKDYYHLSFFVYTTSAYSVAVSLAALGNIFFVFKTKNNLRYSFVLSVFFTALVYISALLLEIVVSQCLVSVLHLKKLYATYLVYFLGGLYCFLMNYFWVFRVRGTRS